MSMPLASFKPARSSSRFHGGVKSMLVPLVGDLLRAQHLLGRVRDHLLGQLHDLQVVGIRPVELQLRELRVVLEATRPRCESRGRSRRRAPDCRPAAA